MELGVAVLGQNKNKYNQIKDIQAETNSPAILNDVINNGLEQYPGQNEKLVQDGALSSFEEEIVKHTVDGKSWNSIKGR